MARICPECRSERIHADLSAHSYASGQIFNRYCCGDCGHCGMFFPEIDGSENH